MICWVITLMQNHVTVLLKIFPYLWSLSVIFQRIQIIVSWEKVGFWWKPNGRAKTHPSPPTKLWLLQTRRGICSWILSCCMCQLLYNSASSWGFRKKYGKNTDIIALHHSCTDFLWHYRRMSVAEEVCPIVTGIHYARKGNRQPQSGDMEWHGTA